MICPKCQHDNPGSPRFCQRCHMTLCFTCPACHHIQLHGGTCDQCGVDFTKFAAMMQFQMESEMRREREQIKARSNVMKQALLLPLTGGWSLLKYMRSAFRNE